MEPAARGLTSPTTSKLLCGTLPTIDEREECVKEEARANRRERRLGVEGGSRVEDNQGVRAREQARI